MDLFRIKAHQLILKIKLFSAKNRPRELPFQLKNWTMENFNAEHAKIKTPSPTYPTTTGFLFSENMVHSPFISPTVFHAGFPYFSSPIFNTPSSSINSLSPSAKRYENIFENTILIGLNFGQSDSSLTSYPISLYHLLVRMRSHNVKITC